MARITVKEETCLDKPLMNTDSLYDMATGSYERDANGHYLINGGIDLTLGVVGKPNTFKSVISSGLMGRCASLYSTKTIPPYILAMDTENSIKTSRITDLFGKLRGFTVDPIKNMTYHLLNKASVPGEKFWSIVTNLMRDIEKSKPIPHQHFKGVAEYPVTMVYVDSLSEFEFSGTVDSVLNSDKDDSSLNTNFMREGLQKTRLIKQFSSIAYRTNIRFILTVHIGKKSTMGESRFSKPTPELKFLKEDEALKGVTGKFSFLISSVITTSNSTILKDPDRKPLYPKDSTDVIETDLNLIRVKILRSKNGPSGVIIPMVCSQSGGFLPVLSAFYFIHKEHKGFGMGGSNTSFNLDLYPDNKYSRKGIRKGYADDKRLARAIMFTAQLKQLEVYTSKFNDILVTPAELREGLIAKGYDMNKILDVRGHWAVNDKDYDEKYLSIMTLLEMNAGLITIKDFLAKK